MEQGGDDGDIKVSDFGLSKATTINSRSLAHAGRTVCGTPNCFSPELVNGDRYGAPADAWAVGLLAYEILTLQHPFLGGSLAALLKRICDGNTIEKRRARRRMNRSTRLSQTFRSTSQTRANLPKR